MSLQSFSLEGKVALVTGCANGIGAGMVRGLAGAGADIFGVYNSSVPQETKASVEALGRRFAGMQADLSNPEFNAQAVIDACVKELGRVDILVNDAGVCLRQPCLEYSREFWDTTLQVNETALFWLSQAAAKQFIAQGSRGKIINIASMLSYHGGVNVSAYTASKHAVVGITKIMASELGAYNINVNAIAPGWISTKLSRPIQENPERNASIVSRIPFGAWGKPDDFQGVAVFLASAASDYITGVTIPVDGGYLVK